VVCSKLVGGALVIVIWDDRSCKLHATKLGGQGCALRCLRGKNTGLASEQSRRSTPLEDELENELENEHDVI
jgi:hypothetical protein